LVRRPVVEVWPDRRQSAASKFGHSLDLHVTAPEQPFIILLEQDGADQAGDAGLVEEDADDIGAPFDYLIETSKRIGAVQF
jgi:hypothetical protein